MLEVFDALAQATEALLTECYDTKKQFNQIKATTAH